MTDKRIPGTVREQYDLFVDGGYTAASSDEYLDVEYPYDGTEWSAVSVATAGDVDAAVGTARTAFEEKWRDVLPSRRREILHQIADALDAHGDELGRLETLQNGKLIREMVGQANALGAWYRYYAGYCDKLEGRVIPAETKGGGMFNYTRKEPLGVVGAITPWNSPLLLTTWKLAPALAAGNTFVHKPSEHTPVSALRFAEIVTEETDLPDGVYNVVTGAGETGAALADHDDLDKLAFTGSTETGRKIGAKAGEKIIPASLELGGKSPNIIFPSANLDNAVNGVVKGIFAATGQTCLAGSRVLVHEDIHDDLVDRLVDRASDITLGDPLEYETEMGPVAFREQWKKDRYYIDQAVEEGGTVAYGGESVEGMPGECSIQPTVLTDMDNDMTTAQEEVFGPVASVIPFSDEDEVLELANETDYGLAAGIWTEDMRQAQRLAHQIDAGTVFVNEYRTVNYTSPFGGYKDSGLGRENGREGIEEYLQTKSVWIDQTGEVDDPFKLS